PSVCASSCELSGRSQMLMKNVALVSPSRRFFPSQCSRATVSGTGDLGWANSGSRTRDASLGLDFWQPPTALSQSPASNPKPTFLKNIARHLVQKSDHLRKSNRLLLA